MTEAQTPFTVRRGELLLERGREAVEIGDYVTALNEFRAAAFAHRTAAALNNWGSMEHCLGDTDRAIELCREAIALDPEWGSPYNNIGSFLVARQQEDQAIVWFERAAALDPGPGQRHVPHINLAKVHLKRGNWRQARKHAELAVRYAPDLDEARDVLSDVEDAEPFEEAWSPAEAARPATGNELSLITE